MKKKLLFSNRIKHLLTVTFLLVSFFSRAQRVLFLKDQSSVSSGVQALHDHLELNGMTVDISDFIEYSFIGSTFNVNGGTPKTLADYDVIVHMNGASYSTAMDTRGQTAIMNFVRNGGGYIGGEWLSYEKSSHSIMNDVILLWRETGVTEQIQYNKVIGLSHPITDNLPSSFATASLYGRSPGLVSSDFSQDVTVLMTSPNSGSPKPSVAIRELQKGRVVFYDHTVGNYGGTPYLNDNNMLELYLSSIRWASGGIDVTGSLCQESNSVNFRVVYNNTQDPISTYSWTISDGTTSTASNILNKTFSASGDYTVTVSLRLQSGSTKTFSRSFKISPTPTVANGGNDVFLSPGTTTATLVGNTPTSGTASWVKVSGPNNPTMSVSGSTLSLSGLTNGQYVFKYTITAQGICDPKFDTVNLYIADVARVSSLTASNITGSSVTLGANVTSDGGAAITSRGFKYGTTPSPTTNQTIVTGTTGAMTANITGLQSGTVYYYIAFAVNSNGTSTTSDGTFTTTSVPQINLTNSSSISTMSSCIGTASTASTFTVSGSNLTNNVIVTVPTGYEVSLSSGSGYSSSVSITASGTLAATTVYVRVASSATAGTINGNVTIASTNVTSQNIAVTATINNVPNLPVASATQLFCSGSTIASLQATAGTGETIQWFAAATGGTALASSTALVAGTTYYTQSVANSCASTRVAVKAVTNNALSFDSSTNYVSLGDTIENLGDITTEAWVYWKGSSLAYSEILTKDVISAFAITSANKLHANFGDGSNWIAGLDSQTSIPLNTWTHVAVTRQNGVVKMFINGVQDAATITNTGTGQNSALRLIGGKMVGSSTTGTIFTGRIDELRFWSVAKTATEIASAMTTNLVGTEPNLVAYYNFNQGIANGTNTSITSLNDVTSSANNGTITNFTLNSTTSNFVPGYFSSITGTNTVGVGSTIQLSHSVSGGTWSSATTGVATVNTSGLVSGVSAGTSVITYTSCGQSTTYTVTVVNPSLSTSVSSLAVTSTCTGVASTASSFTVSGSNLTNNVTVTAPTGHEVSLTSGSGYGASVSIIASGTLASTTVYVRLASSVTAGAKNGNVTVTSTNATTRNVAVSGTVNSVAQLSIQNSLCTSQGLYWSTWSNVTSTTATGTIGNVGVTVQHSAGGLSTTSTMFSHATFPSQYSVPNGTTLRNDKAGTFTFTFDQPVNNPQVAFSSIGNPSNPVGLTTSVPYERIWNGSSMTYTDSTHMTGNEGFTIVRFPGTHTSITIQYDRDETYANIAFGAENFNCSAPTVCQGQPITLTATGGSAYLWTPSTGLSATNTSSVIATPLVTTTYTVTDPNNSCATPATATINVNPVPTAPTASVSQLFCPGSTIASLQATASSGATIQWFAAATGGTALVSSTALVAGTTYYAQAVNANGCASTRTAVTAATNNALSFDGVNDRVNLTSNSIQDGATAFTIEAWIKPNNSNWDNAYHAIFGNQTGGPANTRNPSFYLKDGKIHIDSYEDGTLTRFDFLTNESLISQNVWSHIALVKEGTTFKVYINGNLAITTPAPNAVNITGPYQLGFIDNYYAGLLDELHFWNVARSATEIATGMNTTLVGTETGLVDYYNFNQGIANGTNTSVTTLLDATTSANTGAITNFNLSSTSSNFVPGYFAQITGTNVIAVGATSQLSHTLNGGIWSSATPAVATVNASGLVTGLSGGTSVITYTYCGQSTIFTVTVKALPTISSISNQLLCANGAPTPVNFVIADLETPVANLTVTATSSNSALLPVSNISFTGATGARTMNYTTLSGIYGTSTVTITVADADGGIAIESFDIQVAPDRIVSSSTVPTLQARTPLTLDDQIVINETGIIDGALVVVSSGFVSGDVLSYTGTLPTGVTKSYNSSTGVLTFNGNITPSELQAIFRAVQINTTSTNAQDRTITFNMGSALPFSGNNHFYQFITASGISWTNAKTAAEQLTFFGRQGYLATVTSAAENQFILSKIQGQGWMGASDEQTENVWKWMTGPEAGTQFWQGLSNGSATGGLYNNWASGEPNNAGNEDYAHFLTNGQWNDYPLTLGGISGYVVEFGGLSNDPCVVTSATKTIHVVVNVAPTNISISASSINENNAANAVIGTLSSTDADAGDTFTYTLVSGTGSTDNTSFSIVGNQLKVTPILDFETKSSYSIRVKSTDAGGLSFEKVFTITVNNVNETPTNISLSASSINENNAANAVIGTLSSTDVDAGDTFTYTLVSGTGSTDNTSFSIVGNQLKVTPILDFETKSSYSIRVKSTDADGLSFEKVFTIIVNNVNESPILSVSQTSFYGVVNVAFPTIVVTNSRGTTNSFVIRPALPAGLNFNTATGTITGTATVALTRTNFTITATNSDGTGSVTFAIWIDLDTDGDGIGNNVDSDIDNDGIPNESDSDPDGDGTITNGTDTDNDGINDANDPDIDGDGILNNSDSDVNGDGTIDNGPDTDNDGINDANDTDIDGDGIPNISDSDVNGDGVLDNGADTDGDGINDTNDSDIDGDGIPNTNDSDVNGDGVLDNGTDTDGDGINDSNDLDIDGDGIPNTSDSDVNGDGTLDNGTDIDGDGINDANDSDIDGDGIPNTSDSDVNGDGTLDNGTDTDGDGINDANDSDIDGDGIPNISDSDINGDGTLDNGTDTDGDGINDANDTDLDGDGIPNTSDSDVNGDGTLDNGTDTDGDGINDANDTDLDGDGIPNTIDSDVDGDGIIDNGTDTDGDGINDNNDSDIDGDGIPNTRDSDINGDGTLDNGSDTDGDGINDVNDTDLDGDGIPNTSDSDMNGDGTIDNGPDTDNDGINDANDPDVDNDGIPNTSDSDVNGDGTIDNGPDTDNDGINDANDSDVDGDGIPNTSDSDVNGDGTIDNGPDTDNDGINDANDPDVDGDGIPNTSDSDVNGDGTIDNGPDTDNDGINDANDPDIDGDGISNTIDSDINGDGVIDNGTDTDGDGTNDANDSDIDGDGIPNISDSDVNGDGTIDNGTDIDNDGTNDSFDLDIDGDGISNTSDSDVNGDGTIDNGPDSDNDGINDANDPDADGDGVTNIQEAIDGTNPLKSDTDGDGVIDSTEKTDGTDPKDSCKFILASQTLSPSAAWNAADCDGDGVPNAQEVIERTNPLDRRDYKDTDSDGIPDYIEVEQGTNPSLARDGRDTDGDGVPDYIENQEGTNPNNKTSYLDTDGDGLSNYKEGYNYRNPGASLDTDRDGTPDYLDLDSDGDSVLDRNDAFPINRLEWTDSDRDGTGDNADTDDDNDGILDACDVDSNGDGIPDNGTDLDADGINDGCDTDKDGDGVNNTSDNCPNSPNTDQADRDNDGLGDSCDTIEINASQAITPNGDGINDTWVVYNLGNHPGSTVRVFNSNGVQVFYSTNYQNNWTGNYEGKNEMLPVGSYLYQIDLGGDGSIDAQGWLYITK